MTKAEMNKKVSEVTGLSQKDVDAVIAAYVGVVIDTLRADRDEKIALGGIGSFKVKNVPERSGKIMLGEKKGEVWTKPAHDEIIFKISSSVKEIA